MPFSSRLLLALACVLVVFLPRVAAYSTLFQDVPFVIVVDTREYFETLGNFTKAKDLAKDLEAMKICPRRCATIEAPWTMHMAVQVDKQRGR